MGSSLLIFRDVTFKMAAWRPYWIFWFPDFGFEYELQTSVVHCLCIWVRAYWFSVTSFLNGCLVAIIDFSVSGRYGFDSVTQVCFGISVSNFMCMFLVALGRSLMIVSYVAFRMAALCFWTTLNYNRPIAHCYPLLLGGGILVDHWSSISSSKLAQVMACCLITPRHCMHQWCIRISEVLWHSPESKSTANVQTTTLYNELQSSILQITDTSPKGWRVHMLCPWSLQSFVWF